MRCRDRFPLAPAMFALCFLVSGSANAENWPQWRGPNSDGISHETGIATHWSKSENVLWSAPLPGQGGATPVIWDDRIFVTSAEGDDLVLIAISTDGEELWKQLVGTGNQDARAGEGNSASPSPSTDGEHVWVFFGTGVLACYTVDGEEVWKFNVQDRYGEFDIQFGMTSTPVLDDGSLYLQLIHGAMRGDYTVDKVIKLDAQTSDEIWAVDRESHATFESKHSYASPFIYTDGDTRFLVTHGGDQTSAYSLEDGKELWRLRGLNGPSELNPGQQDPTFRFISSPATIPGAVIVPTAKNGPLVIVNINEYTHGDITDSGEAIRWTYERTPDVSIPLVVDGLAYLGEKNGRLFCLDMESGELMYHERLHAAEHRASPVYADGHIYWCAKDGICSVIKPGPELEVVAENDLEEPMTASPAISNGVLYLRTYEALYAIQLGAAQR